MDTEVKGALRYNIPLKHIGRIHAVIRLIPPSSAAIERNFSILGWIYSTKRQKMTAEKLNKLSIVMEYLK